MDLPNNEIGVSDLLGWRDCPRRMAFGMARHQPREVTHPETGEKFTLRERPEAVSANTAYGSALHDAIHLVEEAALSDDEAATEAMKGYAAWLDPDDLAMLVDDLLTFHGRDYRGVRTLVQEEDHRVPLMDYEGETIYFRFKLDKLYQRLDDESRMIHVDYKSSKYAKSEEELRTDVQMWSYNWGIHEEFPECEDLLQVYDQLRHGQVDIPRKSEREREKIKQWLQTVAIAVIEDHETLPKFNEWCPWCAIKFDCPVVAELGDYAQARIAALAPREKQGRKSVISLDPKRYDEYVAELDKASRGGKTLERFVEEVRSTIKALPDDRRQRLGFALGERKATQFDALAKQEMHEIMGDRFYAVAGITKSGLETEFGEGEEAILTRVMDLAEEVVGATTLKKA